MGMDIRAMAVLPRPTALTTCNASTDKSAVMGWKTFTITCVTRQLLGLNLPAIISVLVPD